MYYSEAIQRIDDKLRAAVWYREDGMVDEIKWDDVAYKSAYGIDQVHPSMEEIETARKIIQTEMEAIAYQNQRRGAYPSIEDVTVALAEKAEGNSAMWDEITAKRQAVKAKYPKG